MDPETGQRLFQPVINVARQVRVNRVSLPIPLTLTVPPTLILTSITVMDDVNNVNPVLLQLLSISQWYHTDVRGTKGCPQGYHTQTAHAHRWVPAGTAWSGGPDRDISSLVSLPHQHYSPQCTLGNSMHSCLLCSSLLVPAHVTLSPATSFQSFNGYVNLPLSCYLCP